MSKVRKASVILVALLTSTAGCATSQVKPTPILATVPSGYLSWIYGIPVLHLKGTGYEMGYQHGSLLRTQVRRSVANAMAFVHREAGFRFLGRWVAHRRLDRAWQEMEPFVPPRYLEELQGLADGAGIPLKVLQRVHALPELTATTCASFAAYAKATKDGKLISMRNLDWAIQSDVQRFAAIVVHQPTGRHPFVNIGWLGFIGVISGINARGISVGEIGSETVDVTLKGVPMPFLLRQVLEESDDLEEAVRLVKESPRTGGYNYLFADSLDRKAVALETTRRHCAVFWADTEPVNHPHAKVVPNAIFRSDFSLDPKVREVQKATGGNPRRPGLESPWGTPAYDVRYWGQGLLLSQFHGQIDPEIAMAIARAIAPKSNMQSIVIAYPQLWVANADGRQPAAWAKYFQVDLRDLFKKE